jgi:hypothetical protein
MGSKMKTKIDVDAIREQAKKEVVDERTKLAVEKLKELYRAREKAVLLVQNIDRDIENYLKHVEESVTHMTAGARQ